MIRKDDDNNELSSISSDTEIKAKKELMKSFCKRVPVMRNIDFEDGVFEI
ncbi:hypothetical protein PGB90_005550 [Kerria lacca]